MVYARGVDTYTFTEDYSGNVEITPKESKSQISRYTPTTRSKPWIDALNALTTKYLFTDEQQDKMWSRLADSKGVLYKEPVERMYKVLDAEAKKILKELRKKKEVPTGGNVPQKDYLENNEAQFPAEPPVTNIYENQPEVKEKKRKTVKRLKGINRQVDEFIKQTDKEVEDFKREVEEEYQEFINGK